MTASMDQAVGTVLARLREEKLEEQTLIFFISDNGGPINKFAHNWSRNTPLRGSKGDTWEGGIRVPFFVQWQGQLPAGKVYPQPVIQLDISATALAVAGVAKPEAKLDGVNLLPYLEGKNTAPPHEALYWRFGEQMAIRQGDWKLVRADLATDQQFGDVAKQPMLFHLADDISEKKDLAAAHPDKVKELAQAWQKWNAGLVPPAWQHHSLQKK
jgi:arylsulfatase A-like enzyme